MRHEGTGARECGRCFFARGSWRRRARARCGPLVGTRIVRRRASRAPLRTAGCKPAACAIGRKLSEKPRNVTPRGENGGRLTIEPAGSALGRCKTAGQKFCAEQSSFGGVTFLGFFDREARFEPHLRRGSKAQRPRALSAASAGHDRPLFPCGGRACRAATSPAGRQLTPPGGAPPPGASSPRQVSARPAKRRLAPTGGGHSAGRRPAPPGAAPALPGVGPSCWAPTRPAGRRQRWSSASNRSSSSCLECTPSFW